MTVLGRRRRWRHMHWGRFDSDGYLLGFAYVAKSRSFDGGADELCAFTLLLFNREVVAVLVRVAFLHVQSAGDELGLRRWTLLRFRFPRRRGLLGELGQVGQKRKR